MRIERKRIKVKRERGINGGREGRKKRKGREGRSFTFP